MCCTRVFDTSVGDCTSTLKRFNTWVAEQMRLLLKIQGSMFLPRRFLLPVEGKVLVRRDLALLPRPSPHASCPSAPASCSEENTLRSLP